MEVQELAVVLAEIAKAASLVQMVRYSMVGQVLKDGTSP